MTNDDDFDGKGSRKGASVHNSAASGESSCGRLHFNHHHHHHHGYHDHHDDDHAHGYHAVLVHDGVPYDDVYVGDDVGLPANSHHDKMLYIIRGHCLEYQ